VITEYILSMFGFLAGSLFDALPAYVVPGWVSSSGAFFSTVFQFAASMGVWFNAPLLVTVLLGVLSVNLFGFGVKLTRSVISVFTGGGGASS
jgi:hypothetical protein